MVKTRKYVYVKRFDGFPKESDLKLVEEELPPLKDGEFLTEAIFLSIDPFMRGYAVVWPLGATFLGSQVAKVIESKNPKHPVGQYVAGRLGCCTHAIASDKTADLDIVPDLEGLPLSLSLGILGMPGNTGYFGFLEICQPKPGETVVVSGAAGAIGSMVGQIAKIKGCTVVGITGSDEKGKWLVDDLNFDHFVNYKDEDFEKKLDQVTPKGIDCYFDNVAGEMTTLVVSKMNPFGRVAVCGAISGYNNQKPEKVTSPLPYMIHKQIKVEGFTYRRFQDRWLEGILQNKEWIKEGKLKYRETVTEGFDNMFQAFVEMLNGKNFGKALVKV